MEFVPAKTILIRTKSGTWFGNDYNINLYRGCCHGCIYCDSRSNCYGVEDFDRVRIKKNALQILERELSKKRKKGVVSIGAMSDPYNPYEEKMEITRGALKLLERYGFGVTLDTKSPLVLRDIDLLKRISRKSCVNIKLTVTAASDFCQSVLNRMHRFHQNVSERSGNSALPGFLQVCSLCRYSHILRIQKII